MHMGNMGIGKSEGYGQMMNLLPLLPYPSFINLDFFFNFVVSKNYLPIVCIKTHFKGLTDKNILVIKAIYIYIHEKRLIALCLYLIREPFI